MAAAGDGAVTDHHHSTQRSRESAIFQLTVTRLSGWRRRRATVAGAARARGALVGSGGGGVGSGDVQSQRRWRQWRRLLHPPPRPLRCPRRRFRPGRCKNFSTVGFVFRARSRHGRPGLGAHRPKPPGGGLLGCNSGSVIYFLSPPRKLWRLLHTKPRHAPQRLGRRARSFIFFLAPRVAARSRCAPTPGVCSTKNI